MKNKIFSAKHYRNIHYEKIKNPGFLMFLTRLITDPRRTKQLRKWKKLLKKIGGTK